MQDIRTTLGQIFELPDVLYSFTENRDFLSILSKSVKKSLIIITYYQINMKK